MVAMKLKEKPKRGTVSKVSDRIPGRSLSFCATLHARVDSSNKRKGERTRDRLKAAAARLLERGGYRDLRVSDINEAAGVSNALFYIYFPNKEKITEEVMTEFLEMLFTPGEYKERPATIEESIYRANLEYVRRFAANSGLMRCLLQFGDEFAEFDRAWRAASARWITRVVQRLTREAELAASSPDDIWCITAALGVMQDGLLRLVHIERDPMTKEHMRSTAPDDRAMATFLTRVWVRALFAREMTWLPPRGESAKWCVPGLHSEA